MTQAGPLDEEQFIALYQGHRLRLARFFTRSVHDRDLAHDLVADTFANAYAQRRSFRGATEEQACAWLWCIARNVLAGHWRRHSAHVRTWERLGPEPPSLSGADLERVEELAGHDQMSAVLGVALRALPPRQKAAIHMRVLDELSYHEIAAALGVSGDVARACVSRGLRSLHADQALCGAVS